jgi:MFS family permease
MGTFCLTSWTVGSVAGSPIGGALYQNLGYKAPFIFCIILFVVDIVGCILVIEKRVAQKWIDPSSEDNVEKTPSEVENGEPRQSPPPPPPSPREEVPTPTSNKEEQCNASGSHSSESPLRSNAMRPVRLVTYSITPFIEVCKHGRVLAGVWLTFVRW